MDIAQGLGVKWFFAVLLPKNRRICMAKAALGTTKCEILGNNSRNLIQLPKTEKFLDSTFDCVD